mgnify:FL=1
MLFNSYNFLIFFPIVTLIYFLIPHKFRYLWLLASSYYFYMCWNAKYALILLASTVITYASGRLIDRANNKITDEKKRTRQKKIYVALSVVINLGILFVFKYFDFAIENINRVLSALNIQILNPSFDIVLPVGISFYIFQALGYTIDVYRGNVAVEKNFLKYALFVSFFPQLLAGPIGRAKSILTQINERHDFDSQRVKDGLLLMIWGGFQKIVIADRVVVVVDTIFNNFPEYGGMYIVVGAILFAFQIYCDFSGYSMIAIGAAKVMGFELMENFNCPYFSMSVAEFWRRWHISLSSWFRDYLYIPLGGNRKGKLRKYINIMIVFLVSGLWHGAQWSYVIWGGLNGAFQIIGDRLKGVRDWLVKKLHLNRETASHKIYKIITTFILIDFTWIFFRASSATAALKMVKSIFTTYNPWILFDGSLFELGLGRKEFQFMILSIIILLIADFIKWKGHSVREWVYKQERWFRWAFYIVAILVVLVFGVWGPAFDESSFIYFQF